MVLFASQQLKTYESISIHKTNKWSRIMQMRFFTMVLIIAVIHGCANSKIRDREYLTLSGEVHDQSRENIPVNAQLHVLLTEINPNEADDKVIATDSKLLQGKVRKLAFSIIYNSDKIKKDSKYLLLACVTANEKVILTSQNDVHVLTQGYSNTGVILLGNKIITSTDKHDKKFSEDDTVLQRGVQSNLDDVCRQKSPGYDHVTRSRASKILPADLLKGPLHQVREQVDIHGPHYFFIIDSEYGQITAQGMTMLRKVVREIYAIEALKKVTGSEAYLKAAGDSAITPFVEVKELVMDPVDTIAGIPKGALKIINSTIDTFTTGRSQYEDSYAQAFITVSKYKRRHASTLGVDVYSSNPLLQIELDRLGWVEALGNWTPSAVLIPFSGPGVMAYKAFSWTETLNRALIEQAPDILRDHNARQLKKMGIPISMRKNFLGHDFYSPRHATILVKALAEIENVQGLELFFQEAVKAESEIDALTFQQIAELLAGYHKTQQKIASIFIHKGYPMGFTQQGAVIAVFPLDYLRWTPFGENMVTGIGPEAGQKKLRIKHKAIWVTGAVSSLGKSNLHKLGFKFTEQVQKQIDMMD
jgi:uncharacterized lipoprotein YbaY